MTEQQMVKPTFLIKEILHYGDWRFSEGSGRREMQRGIVATLSMVPLRPSVLRD